MIRLGKQILLLFVLVAVASNVSFAQEDSQSRQRQMQKELEAAGEKIESVEASEENTDRTVTKKKNVKKKKTEKDSLKKSLKKSLVKFKPQEGNQQPWGFYGSYSIYDTWIPTKIGFIATYGNADRTWELAWQRASYSINILSLDLGEVSDTRYHLTTRSFSTGRSFNFQYGIYYNKLEAGLGNEFTDSVGESKDLFRVSTAGVMWAMGNRWTWSSGFSVGMDWFKIFWPLTIVDEDIPALDSESLGEDERDDLEAAKNTVTKLPTFSLLHFEIGYRF